MLRSLQQSWTKTWLPAIFYIECSVLWLVTTHNVRYLCPLVATVYCTAEKKSAAHRAEATEISQEPEGDRGSVLPSPRLDKNTGNNSICTSIATELRALVTSYRRSCSYRARYGTYFNRVRALNFYYSNSTVRQKSFHIHSINNSSFVEDPRGLHWLHHLLSDWKHLTTLSWLRSHLSVTDGSGTPGKIRFLWLYCDCIFNPSFLKSSTLLNILI